ncbi:MAG: nucleoid-associated protein, partial [Muriicola sp.]
MINLFNAQIDSLSLHRVGNKQKNEGVFLSEETQPLNDETRGLLKEFFLKPFRDKEENYFKLTHETDLEFNEIYQAAKAIFNEPASLQEHSKKITRFLYEQSN